MSIPFAKNRGHRLPVGARTRSRRSRRAGRNPVAALARTSSSSTDVAVRLQLTLEHRPVALDQACVGLTDRVERLFAGLPGRGLAERLERAREARVHDRDEELLLRAEEPEEVRLGDTGRAGDRVGRGAVQACVGRTRASAASSTASRRTAAVCLVAVAIVE